MCLHFLVPSTEKKKSGFRALKKNIQEFFCVHLCPMTLLIVKVFYLFGILFLCSFVLFQVLQEGHLK